MKQIQYSENLAKIIKNGGIGILPTDTMYGIVGSAMIPEVVEKIYTLRKRDLNKKCIILIGSISELEKFNISLSTFAEKVTNRLWPGPFSIELPIDNKNFEYLTKGKTTLAFRVPDNKNLQELLKEIGPLIAPSANTEGALPSTTIEDARKYFPSLDFYIDFGKMENNPSTVISIENDKIEIIRQGIGQIPKEMVS